MMNIFKLYPSLGVSTTKQFRCAGQSIAKSVQFCSHNIRRPYRKQTSTVTYVCLPSSHLRYMLHTSCILAAAGVPLHLKKCQKQLTNLRKSSNVAGAYSLESSRPRPCRVTRHTGLIAKLSYIILHL